MPLVDAIKSLFSKPEQKAIVGMDPIGRTNPIYSSADAGLPVSFTSSNRDAAATTYTTIVSNIMDAAKPISWAVYKLTSKDENGQKVPNHPLATMLYRPNAYQTMGQFTAAYIAQRKRTGNAFIYCLQAGSASELHLLPDNTEVIPGPSQIEQVKGYRYLKQNGGYQEFELNQVLHIKDYDMRGELYGLSALQVGALNLRALEVNLQRRILQYAKGGPKHLIWNNIAATADVEAEPLTDEQRTAFYNQLGSDHPYTYSDYPIDAKAIGLSVVELDLLNALSADVGMLADLLHYPSVLLSSTKNSTFNNMKEAKQALYTDCILPMLYDLKEGLNFKFGAAFKDQVYLDYDTSAIAVLKPDQAPLITAASTANFLTINEKRKMAGYPALAEGGDGFLLSAADIYSATIDEEHEQPQPDTYAPDDSAVAGE